MDGSLHKAMVCVYMLSFRNAKTVDLYINRRVSENQALCVNCLTINVNNLLVLSVQKVLFGGPWYKPQGVSRVSLGPFLQRFELF